MSAFSADIAGNIAGGRAGNPNKAPSVSRGERLGWGPKAIAQRFNTWKTNHNIAPIKGLQQKWTEFKANRAQARHEAQMSRAQRSQKLQQEAAAANQARSHAAKRTDAVAAYRAETSVDGALARTNALKTALTNNGYGTVAREVDLLIVQIAQKNNSGQLQEARDLLNKFMARDEVNNAIDWNNMQASRGQLTRETLTKDISALAADAAERSYRDTQRLTRATEKSGQQVQRGFRAVLRQIHDGIMNLPEAKALMSKLEKLSESKLAKMLPLVAMAAAAGTAILIPGLAPFIIAGMGVGFPLYSAAMVIGRGSRAVHGAEDASYYGDEQTLKRADRVRQERIQNTAQSHMMSIFDADSQDGRSFQQRFDNCFDLIEGRYVLKNINSIRPEQQAQFRADLEALRVTTEIARLFEGAHDGRHAFTFRGNIPDGATITNGHQLDAARKAIEGTRRGGYIFSNDQLAQISTRLAQMETNLRADRAKTEVGTGLRVASRFATVPLAMGALNLIHTGGNIQEALQTVMQTSYVGKFEHLAGLVNTDILHHGAEAATNIQHTTVEIHFDKDHVVNGFPPETKLENGVLSYHGVDFAHDIKIEGNVLTYHSGPPGVDTPLRTINLDEMKEIDVNKLFEEQFADNPLTSAENMQSFMPDVVKLPDGTLAYVFSGDHLAHGVDWTNQQFSVFDGNGNNILVPMQNLQGLHLTSALTNMPVEHGIIVSADPTVSTHALGQFLNGSPNALSAEHYTEFYNTWVSQHGTPPLPSDVITATGQNLFSHQVGLTTDALSGHGDLIATNNLWDPHLIPTPTEALISTPDVQGFNVMGQMMGGIQLDWPTIHHAFQVGLSGVQHELGNFNPFQPGGPIGPGGPAGDFIGGVGSVAHAGVGVGQDALGALEHTGIGGEVAKILHGDFQGVWNDFLNAAEHNLNMSQDQWNAMANDTHGSVSADGTFHLGQYVTGFGRHGIASFQFAGGMLFLTRFNKLPWNKGRPILQLPPALAQIADVAQMAFLSTTLFGMPGLVGTLLLNRGAKTAALGVAPGMVGGAWRGIEGQWGPGGFARSGTTRLGRVVRPILGVPGVVLNFAGGAVAGAARGGGAAFMTPLGFPPNFRNVLQAGWTGNANPTAPAATPVAGPVGAPPTPGAPGAAGAAFEQAMNANRAARNIRQMGIDGRPIGAGTNIPTEIVTALGVPNEAAARAVLNAAITAGGVDHLEAFADGFANIPLPPGVTMNRALAENLAIFRGVSNAADIESMGRALLIANAIQETIRNHGDIHQARNAAFSVLRDPANSYNVTTPSMEQARSIIFALEHAFLTAGGGPYADVINAINVALTADIPVDVRPVLIAAVCIGERMALTPGNRFTPGYLNSNPMGTIYNEGIRDALGRMNPGHPPTYEQVAQLIHAVQNGLAGTNRAPTDATIRRNAIIEALVHEYNVNGGTDMSARLAAGIAAATEGTPQRQVELALMAFTGRGTFPPRAIPIANIPDAEWVEFARALESATTLDIPGILTTIRSLGTDQRIIDAIQARINPIASPDQILTSANINVPAERTDVYNILQQFGLVTGATDADFNTALQAAALAAVGTGRVPNEARFYTDIRDALLAATTAQARAEVIENAMVPEQHELRVFLAAHPGITATDIITAMQALHSPILPDMQGGVRLNDVYRIIQPIPQAQRADFIQRINGTAAAPHNVVAANATEVAQRADALIPSADLAHAIRRAGITAADEMNLVDAAIRNGLIPNTTRTFAALTGATINLPPGITTQADALNAIIIDLRAAITAHPGNWDTQVLALERFLQPDQYTFREELRTRGINIRNGTDGIIDYMQAAHGAGFNDFEDADIRARGITDDVAAMYQYIRNVRGAALPNFAGVPPIANAEQFVVALDTIPYADAAEAFRRENFVEAHRVTPLHTFTDVNAAFTFINRIPGVTAGTPPNRAILAEIQANIGLFTGDARIAVIALTQNAEDAFNDAITTAGGSIFSNGQAIAIGQAIQRGLQIQGVAVADIPTRIIEGARAAHIDNDHRAAIAVNLNGANFDPLNAFNNAEQNVLTLDQYALIARGAIDAGANLNGLRTNIRTRLRNGNFVYAPIIGSVNVPQPRAAAAAMLAAAAAVHGTGEAGAQAALHREIIRRNNLDDAFEVLNGIHEGLRAAGKTITLTQIDTIAQAAGYRDIEQRAAIIARQDGITGGSLTHQTEETFNLFLSGGHTLTAREVAQVITGIRNANGITINTDPNNANILAGFNTLFRTHNFLRMCGVALLDPQPTDYNRVQVAIDDWINGNVTNRIFLNRAAGIAEAQGAERRNILDALEEVGFNRALVNGIITAL